MSKVKKVIELKKPEFVLADPNNPVSYRTSSGKPSDYATSAMEARLRDEREEWSRGLESDTHPAGQAMKRQLEFLSKLPLTEDNNLRIEKEMDAAGSSAAVANTIMRLKGLKGRALEKELEDLYEKSDLREDEARQVEMAVRQKLTGGVITESEAREVDIDPSLQMKLKFLRKMLDVKPMSDEDEERVNKGFLEQPQALPPKKSK